MLKLMTARCLSSARYPRVSIIVPCYNYGHFLLGCVDSLLSQRSVEVGILIIDDASPDGSGSVAEALAATDPRISVIRHKYNRGHIATYNEGLDHVDGDYTVLLSADDLLPHGALTRAVALLEANASVGLAYGYPVNFSGSDLPPARHTVHSWSIWPGARWIRAQCRRGLSCIYSPEVVMRTSVQRDVGGFRHSLPHSADLELWLRIAAVADIGRVNGSDQAYRRVHDASMMQSSYAGLLADLEERGKAYEAFFAASGGAIRGGRGSLAIVRRRLAEEAIEGACHLLETGDAKTPSVAEYISFARESYAHATRLRPWKEYTLLLREGDCRQAARLRRRGYAVRRHLEERLRFRRWQWTGV